MYQNDETAAADDGDEPDTTAGAEGHGSELNAEGDPGLGLDEIDEGSAGDETPVPLADLWRTSGMSFNQWISPLASINTVLAGLDKVLNPFADIDRMLSTLRKSTAVWNAQPALQITRSFSAQGGTAGVTAAASALNSAIGELGRSAATYDVWKSVQVSIPKASPALDFSKYVLPDYSRFSSGMDFSKYVLPDYSRFSSGMDFSKYVLPDYSRFSSGMDFSKYVLPDFRARLADVLRMVREQLDAADDFACSLYLAAQDARDAVLGDLESRPVVRRFARTWLRISNVTEHVLDAVVEVLLSDDSHEPGMTGAQLLDHLRTRAKERHEVHRPIFDRQFNHQRIGSLSVEVATPSGIVTLDQTVAGADSTEDTALALNWADPRISPLLSKLAPDDQAVIEAIACYPGITWQDAAAVVGVSPQQAETTRRKAKYLVKEQNRRAQMRQQNGAPGRRSVAVIGERAWEVRS
jgi:hypothetical protein